ncbi:hypothetical protein CC86DRAFT_399570 [Ophiobolus disseminans]|uniref:Uncharacterized protein n=1 Tax=Ophiobolus disseminans TaxID=1469910 RepID=A0A6A7AIH5_9PLEO|nr:hypothetical protein CC86DRAFT_399570 [Ophiobolus disseminans]
MGKTRKAMIAFIDEIPASKLEGGISSNIIYTDNRNFRLDNQGTTTAKDDATPFSVADMEMPVDDPWSAAEIKEALKKSCLEHGDKTGGF